MKKFFVGVVLSVILVANSALAMTFSQPVKIGEIGFPVQAPYHGLVVKDANYNDGNPYQERSQYKQKPFTTYTNGTARFGYLWCKYNFAPGDSSNTFINFGGKNDFVLASDISYKKIFSIGNDADLKLYAVYHYYCVTDLKILGTRNDGKWVVYIDSKKLSEKYFGSKDGYKLVGGVIYDEPTCAGDTIVVKYRRWNWGVKGGVSEPEGEFRFKWNDRAQWFGVEKIVY